MNHSNDPTVSKAFVPALVIIDGDQKYEFDEKNRLRNLTVLVDEDDCIYEYDSPEARPVPSDPLVEYYGYSVDGDPIPFEPVPSESFHFRHRRLDPTLGHWIDAEPTNDKNQR